MGAENQTKGRVGRQQRKQAPPTDSGTATSAGDLPGKPPAGRVVCHPAPVPPGFSPRGCKGRSPRRHWLSPPRGRGPSQTPPSLATDSSISPGPPSPWLPALLPIDKQNSLVVQVPPGLRPLLPSPIKTARNPRPQSGRGRSRPARGGSSGNADYISIPMFLFSASSSEQRQQRQRSAEPQRHLRR